MFSENEALALTLGLLTARQLGLESATLAVEGALAKVLRVMPQELREQAIAVQETLVVEENTSSSQEEVAHNVVATIGLAIRQRRQVRLGYQAFDGAVSMRVFDPYGLVNRHGRWYSMGYCHLRSAVRIFRLDRMLETALLDSTFTPPKAFNPLDAIERGLAKTPRQYRTEVLIKATLEEAQAQIPLVMGVLTAVEEGVVLVCYVQSLKWLALFLVDLTLPLVICQPAELRDEMQRLQLRVAQILAGESITR